MKKENVFKIAIIVVAVAITGGVVGFKLTQRIQAPTEQAANVKAAPVVSKQEPEVDQTIPAGWKTYMGDLSGLSAKFVGKKVSFNYPAEWGEVKIERMTEGDASWYDFLNITFSSGPEDKHYQLTSGMQIVDAEKYKTEVPKDVTFLEKILSSSSPVGENDLRALNALGHGYGSTVFFGVNLAKKFVPKNITTGDQAMKGLTFFMQDNQAPGTDLIYEAVLLDQKAGVIVGGDFFLSSKQQDQLESELSAIGTENDKKNQAAIGAWSKKMEALINSSYTSNPDYMTQVNDIDSVMKSLKIQ